MIFYKDRKKFLYVYTRLQSRKMTELERDFSKYKVPRYVWIVGAEILLPQIGEFLASHFFTLRRSKQFREIRSRLSS